MKLIIIQGAPATGKTTIGLKLIRDLGYSHLFKDAYKESQYDLLGHLPNFKEWRQIELAGWQEVYNAIANAQTEDRSLIIEGNFMNPQIKNIRTLIKPNAEVIELFLFARGWASFTRHIMRNKSGGRHKSHRDHLWYPASFMANLLEIMGMPINKPLGISEHILKLDTTDFLKVDYQKILAFVKS